MERRKRSINMLFMTKLSHGKNLSRWLKNCAGYYPLQETYKDHHHRQ
ncbi:hypothetical protein [Prevotella nigrescens]|nr:hypothetical protein [Prevotella nigrescens]